VEVTTGPLGQGFANGVGMALAERFLREKYGADVMDHFIYAIVSDGDLMEGVASEAASIAGQYGLGKLVYLYDDNSISLDGPTSLSFDTEDVTKRFEAYGWDVSIVDDANDLPQLERAIDAAMKEEERPSLIRVKSIIGWPSPHKQGTSKAHGSALGEDEVRATKQVLGFDPDQHFEVDEQALARAREVVDKGRQLHAEWNERFAKWKADNPDRFELWDRLRQRRLPAGWQDKLPTFEAGKAVASRKASSGVLNALKDVLPELWGGSADLAESNNTTMEGEPSFLPTTIETKLWGQGNPYGRILHFGIREHAMGSIMNGIALHGGLRVYGGTFLVFSDYMRPAVRLAAIQKLPVTYVWTHDSIGLGEDGPTHQPVEHLASLRAIPNLDVVRPADANETAWAWRTVLEHTDRPAGLCLSRQNLPTFDRSPVGGFGAADGVAKGAYVLQEADGGEPQVILVGTGSEVQIAVAAREVLQGEGIPTRVVSMPCWEWFFAQDQAYRDSVFPPSVRARVSVEAGVAQGWRAIVGDAGRCVSLEHFGASADYQKLYEEFGFTKEHVVAAAKESLAAAGV
jgi:transketolase